MKKIHIFVLMPLLLLSCSKEIKAPLTEKISYKEKRHNLMIEDNYHWLKDKTRKDEKVINHIKAENTYAKEVLKHTEKLQEEIFNEIKSRIVEENISVPVKIDNYLYYSKSLKELQYPKYFRKLDKPNAKEECYLDENIMAKGKKFFSLSARSISPNQNLLAMAIDTTGAEKYLMKIKNLKTGKYLSDTAKDVGDICWLNDNTLFYTIEDESSRTYRMYKHKLGDKSEKDKLIYQEDDPLYYLSVYKSKSKRFIIMESDSKNSSEIKFMDIRHPEKGFKLIEPRQENVEYYISDYKDSFFIQTNADGATNYKIMKTPISNPQKKYWKTYISENDSIAISMSVFSSFMALKERKNGLVQFKIKPFNGKSEFYIDFPEPTYSAYSLYNPDYNAKYFRFGYESFVTPYSIYDFYISTGKKVLRKQTEINGGYDKNGYLTERLFATASDGVKIPISIVYKKMLHLKNGLSPLLLTAYGAYGDANDPYFSSLRLSLLDRGFSLAIAHVRGGGEFGQKWYNAGKMLNKKNTFTDFITCSKYLIKNNYTSPKHLYIEGGSAGGLLIGAVLNMKSDIYAGVIADVPFVDVLNTMFDPTLTSTTSEYKEWGNPNIKIYFDYIRSYCPYQNVKRKSYPPILALAGFYDTRVNYWEPAKWVAKLRDYKTDNNKILLVTNMNAGHMGASGKYDFYKEFAMKYAYLIDLEMGKK